MGLLEVGITLLMAQTIALVEIWQIMPLLLTLISVAPCHLDMMVIKDQVACGGAWCCMFSNALAFLGSEWGPTIPI